MERREWVTRFASKLHAQWPRLPREQVDEVASELLDTPPWQPRWEDIDPEAAAEVWLGHGVLQDHPEAQDENGGKP